MVTNHPVDLGEKILTAVNNSLENFYGKECFVSKYDIINDIHILYFTVRTPKVKIISPSHVFKYETKMIKRDIVQYDDARTQLFSIAERFCECVNKHKFKLPNNVTLFMHNSKFNFGISVYKSIKDHKYDYTKYFNVLPQLHKKEMNTDNISRYIRNMESRESMMFSKVWTIDLNTLSVPEIIKSMETKLEPGYFTSVTDEFPHAICVKLHPTDRTEDFVHKLFRHEIMAYKKDTSIEELFYLNLIKQHNIDVSIVKDLKVLMFADFDNDNTTQNRYILYRISPSYDESYRIRLFIFFKCLLELYYTEKQIQQENAHGVRR